MAWSRVQGGNFYNSAGSTTAAVTISAVGSGNAVLGCVTWEHAGGIGLNSVTDNQGNTYNLESEIIDTGNSQRSRAFSLTNIANGPTTITANFSGSTGYRGVVADEFS